MNVRKIMIEDEETKANNGRRFDDACADEPDAKKHPRLYLSKPRNDNAFLLIA